MERDADSTFGVDRGAERDLRELLELIETGQLPQVRKAAAPV